MDYSMEELLDFDVEGDVHHQWLCDQISECEIILIWQEEWEHGRLTHTQGVDVAMRKIAKELELKELYMIPIWHNATLEWFHASFVELYENYWTTAE